jgi:Glycosyl transferases group 1
MKILLAQGLNYLFAWGGAYKGNRILLRGLADRGHECHVLTLSNPLTYDEYVDKLAARCDTVTATARGAMCQHEGIGIHVAKDSVQMCMQLMELIQELRPTWTLVSEDTTFMLVAAALEADPSRVVYLARTGANLPFGPDCMAADPSKAEILSRTAGILTVSNYMADYIKRWGGMKAKSIYWPAHGKGPFPHFHNFDQGYVTQINPCKAKGLPIFLELARQMPGVQFATVPTWGTGDAELQALAQLSNVRILQPQEDVNKIFAQTRVLLAPSLWAEAFGQVVVEAMARGIPVMASNLGGLPEAKLGVDYVLPVRQLSYRLTERKDFVEVVPEQDVTPWVEALRELLSDRPRYERLSAASRDAALAFIAGLGIEPFEEYLEHLSPVEPARRSQPPEAAKKQTPQAVAVQQRLQDMSPERRVLLLVRLSQRVLTSNGN